MNTPVLLSSRLQSHLQRRTAGYTYTDTAQYRVVATGALDEYGHATSSDTWVFFPCSFSPSATLGKEKWLSFGDVAGVDVEMRMSAPRPSKGGVVRLLTKAGTPFPPDDYEIVEILDRGALGFVCALKRVKV